MTSEVVIEQLTTEISVIINTSQLQNGVYLSKLLYENGQYSTRKIIIEK